MPTVLLVFEFLGTTELLVVAVVALILFGPRKLPEIGRTIGKAMGEFKRASDDFKRTWEYEVEIEQRSPALDAAGGAPVALETAAAEGEAALVETPADDPNAEEFAGRAPRLGDGETTVARGSSDEEVAAPETRAADEEVNAS